MPGNCVVYARQLHYVSQAIVSSGSYVCQAIYVIRQICCVCQAIVSCILNSCVEYARQLCCVCQAVVLCMPGSCVVYARQLCRVCQAIVSCMPGSCVVYARQLCCVCQAILRCCHPHLWLSLCSSAPTAAAWPGPGQPAWCTPSWCGWCPTWWHPAAAPGSPSRPGRCPQRPSGSWRSWSLCLAVLDNSHSKKINLFLM